MSATRSILLAILIVALIAGCASNPFVGLPAVPAYQPSVRPGMNYVEAKLALQELLAFMPGIKVYQKDDWVNHFLFREGLMSQVRDGNDFYQFNYNSNDELIYMLLPKVRVLDDRIVLSSKLALKFGDMVKATIVAERVDEKDAKTGTFVHPTSNSPDWTKRFYRVRVTGWADFVFEKYADAVRCADNLHAIQQALKGGGEDRHAIFASRAAQYRAAKVKPPVSEAQRKLIVQANVMNQKKEYAKAIDYYLKAVDVDPVAYPAAYFNLALLAAQLQWYGEAIGYMQQYLLLDPDAKDARSAQDKIYEWEALLGK